MVRTIRDQDREVHVCGDCGLGYATRDLAERCEAHCTTYHACSLEITRHAIYGKPS